MCEFSKLTLVTSVIGNNFARVSISLITYRHVAVELVKTATVKVSCGGNDPCTQGAARQRCSPICKKATAFTGRFQKLIKSILLKPKIELS